MTGNDIIDLQIALKTSRSKNHRFLNKIFTQNEKIYIASAKNPELLLWKFWAMKEACYKLHQRIFNLSRKINPVQFDCTLLEGPVNGLVEIDEYNYECQLTTTSSFIHCIVYFPSYDFQHLIFKDEKDPKTIFLEDLSKMLNAKPGSYTFTKDQQGIPSLRQLNSPASWPVSISHHGRYFAITYPLIMS